MAPTSGTDTARPVIVLFRHDLRIADNKALSAAASSGKPIVAAFVFDEESPGTRSIGGARRWWLHHSLQKLSSTLKSKGLRLLLRRGVMQDVVEDLVRQSGADTVFWNRRYDPPAVKVDTAMKTALGGAGIECESFDGHLLHEPWQIKTGAGKPYRVYTPFWRALRQQIEPRDPIDAPRKLRAFAEKLRGETLDDWKLLPYHPDWAGGLREEWTPGEEGAHRRLENFLADSVSDYADGRDRPDKEATSRLSPHLAHGEITPFQVWHAVRHMRGHGTGNGPETFLKEIVWREFCWHLLFHNPDLAHSNFDSDFDAFDWRDARKAEEAWQKGATGYPIIDAGMRQLWQTGWMHNRVRMIVASFLIKDLMVDWRRGEKWFWDTLVDADPASNAANWQWVAGSGADAAPFFRIFNPVLQGRKFDRHGDYVRRYVPEISGLPPKHIHEPWKADTSVLADAGVKLGATYPVAIVDHGEARDRALAQFRKIKGKE